MAVRNVARGGGKAYKEPVRGLKELEKKLKALLPDNPQLRDELYRIVGAAADEMRDEMRSQAQAAGWGSQRLTTRRDGVVSGDAALRSIFSYAKPRGGDNSRKRIAALAGVGKPRTMVEWIAGRHPKSPRAKVAPGGRVAMAFATMLEFGTTRMSARPAIRTAVRTAKQRIIDSVASGYRGLLEKYTR